MFLILPCSYSRSTELGKDILLYVESFILYTFFIYNYQITLFSFSLHTLKIKKAISLPESSYTSLLNLELQKTEANKILFLGETLVPGEVNGWWSSREFLLVFILPFTQPKEYLLIHYSCWRSQKSACSFSLWGLKMKIWCRVLSYGKMDKGFVDRKWLERGKVNVLNICIFLWWNILWKHGEFNHTSDLLQNKKFLCINRPERYLPLQVFLSCSKSELIQVTLLLFL